MRHHLKKWWNNMSVNQRIKEIRQAVGLPQAKFAERIAISTGYIAELELGKKNVTERIVRLVGMEFGADEHWLKTGEGVMFSNDADTKALKAASLFKLLNPRLQDFALTQLNDLIELCNSPDK
jgi:transcriptional regulator with XRE-family HTH domain